MTPTKTKGVGVTDQPEKKARDGVVADPRLFKFYGTTDCKSCETGRVTLFVANDECMMCNPDSYQAKTPTDSDSVSVPREKNVQILIDALENAKTDLRDLDTVCMADYKLVISGFSRAVLSIQIALSDFRKAQALSRGGE